MNEFTIVSQNDIEALEQQQDLASLFEWDSTYDAIRATASRMPRETAMSFFLKGQEYNSAIDVTYKELIEKITQTANFFNQLGLTSDDVIAFVLPNMPETHYVMWGGEAACQIFAINPLLESDQIKELINSAGAKAIVTMNPMPKMDLWEKIERILPELQHTLFVVGIDIAHYVTGFEGIAAKGIQFAKRGRAAKQQSVKYYNYHSSVRYQSKTSLDFKRTFTSQTVSSLFCTGGTTGLPKIAFRTHRNELANALSVKKAAGALLGEGKTILGGLPLFHVNGALVTGLIPFMTGAKVVIATPQGYRGENVFPHFWDIIEHFKVNAFSGVPTVYSALMNFPIDGKDLSSLEYCLCGAAPMPVETFKAFEAMAGVRILEGYGLTEGTCVSSINPPEGTRKIGSIGMRIPYQKMLCAEVGEDNKVKRVCGVNEIGVLLVRGPNVFLGYKHEHQNKDLWVKDLDNNVWLNTGDLARQDEEGYFWLAGRKKELIVRGGHNIEPKMIEEAMCLHPAVSLAAAVGKPDPHAGEVPVCYVQPQGESRVSGEELLQFAQENIPERAAIPKAIHVVSELPVTAVGKVFKPQLEMQEIEKSISESARAINPTVELTVDVGQHPLHGLFARVRLNAASHQQLSALKKELGKYTFKFDLENTDD